MKRTISFILAAVFALGAFVSCSQKKNENKPEEKNIFGDLSEYVIIRPDKSDGFEKDAARSFRDQILEKTGTMLFVQTDWVKRGDEPPANAKEILIGLTNREGEDSPARALDEDSCYIAFDGTKLHIVAGGELSMLYALYAFFNEEGRVSESGVSIKDGFSEVITLDAAKKEIAISLSGAAKYIGLADVLDEEDKTHGQYGLVWSEEFEGGAIDKKIWNYEYGYIANNELQGYTDRAANSGVKHGCLVIEANKEKYEEFNYTSARLNTRGKYSFMYGYIEMRAILPEGKGIWPAFWMMGNNGSWPACGEIDIMEMIGGKTDDDKIYGTIHYGTSNPYNHKQLGGDLQTGLDLSEGFHTYGLEWTEKKLAWFIDGREFYSCDITGPEFDIFRQNFYILVNLAVGGDWPGSPDKTTKFPQQYVIDYIRVYQ